MIKMKQILAIIMILNVMLFRGCSETDNDKPEKVFSSTAPQIMFDKIIPTLDNKNSEELKSLFSQKALAKTPNIDEQITALFDLYQGKFVSNSHFDSGASTGHSEWGLWVYLFINPTIRELVTDKAVYTLRFYAVSANDDDPNDVGLCGIWLELKDGDKVVKECKVGITNEG